MSNNPVQIILNDTDFHRAPEPGQPPRNRDFFDGADRAFADHQAALIAAIEAVIVELQKSPYGPATYLRVQMRDEALAKSYRPRWLFKPDQFPCVGAEAVGTLYFRAPLIYLEVLKRRVQEAELTVEIKHRRVDDKAYKAPSIARAEVGAVELIEIVPPEQKRAFSVSAALAAFSDLRTVSGYQIELFETPDDRVIADDPLGRITLRRTLEQVLFSLGTGARSYVMSAIGRTPVLELQITRADQPALVDNRPELTRADLAPAPQPAPIDRDPERHEAVLAALQAHPLVRAIFPPVLLQLTDEESLSADEGPRLDDMPLTIPTPVAGATYPIVGVIDSGVGAALKDWVVGRFDYLDSEEHDSAHGTGVAGLISVPQLTNTAYVTPEANGCLSYDAPLYPKGSFVAKYSRGFNDFLEEVEQAVAEAKEQHGVRVFNLSINAVSDVERHRYSIYASRLDQIADTYGVIFVNSAGNLPRAQSRAPWPKRPVDVVRYFAARTSPDTIFKPAESVRSISVGALNPPLTKQVTGAPTVYTRRGPGLQIGIKPDVAAYGGAGGGAPGDRTGLSSIALDGRRQDVVGTSYAAPLVARTLAGLDAVTQGGLNTEALRAMLLHHTAMPEPLSKRGMKDIARQFAGFGQPAKSSTCWKPTITRSPCCSRAA